MSALLVSTVEFFCPRVDEILYAALRFVFVSTKTKAPQRHCNIFQHNENGCHKQMNLPVDVGSHKSNHNSLTVRVIKVYLMLNAN